MDYIGSKEKLNNWIFSIINSKNQNFKELIFMDGCSGSGAISKYGATLGFKKIISNDILEFSRHIIRGAVSLPLVKQKEANEIIKELNGLKGVSGFFYENYSESSGRIYFTDYNAKKIDAARIFIEKLKNNNILLKSYLLYCLLEAMSAVSNTTGVQAAFLKKIKSRASKQLDIVPKPSLHKPGLIKTYNDDILKLLKNDLFTKSYSPDILYIDPPYNSRQYGPNYHLYETLVKYDNPKIYGKTGIRDWKSESKSDFCSKKTCVKFTHDILSSTQAKNIYISYNSDGIMDIEELNDELSKT